jgi:hypothetical protein
MFFLFELRFKAKIYSETIYKYPKKLINNHSYEEE